MELLGALLSVANEALKKELKKGAPEVKGKSFSFILEKELLKEPKLEGNSSLTAPFNLKGQFSLINLQKPLRNRFLSSFKEREKPYKVAFKKPPKVGGREFLSKPEVAGNLSKRGSLYSEKGKLKESSLKAVQFKLLSLKQLKFFKKLKVKEESKSGLLQLAVSDLYLSSLSGSWKSSEKVKLSLKSPKSSLSRLREEPKAGKGKLFLLKPKQSFSKASLNLNGVKHPTEGKSSFKGKVLLDVSYKGEGVGDFLEVNSEIEKTFKGSLNKKDLKKTRELSLKSPLSLGPLFKKPLSSKAGLKEDERRRSLEFSLEGVVKKEAPSQDTQASLFSEDKVSLSLNSSDSKLHSFSLKEEVSKELRFNLDRGSLGPSVVNPSNYAYDGSGPFQDEGSQPQPQAQPQQRAFSGSSNFRFQVFTFRADNISMRLVLSRSVMNLTLQLPYAFTSEPLFAEEIRNLIRSCGFTPGKVYLKFKGKPEGREKVAELKV
ncbi:hypothetical protein [Thermovibrio sp.]